MILREDWTQQAIRHTCPEASLPPQTVSHPLPFGLLESEEEKRGVIPLLHAALVKLPLEISVGSHVVMVDRDLCKETEQYVNMTSVPITE